MAELLFPARQRCKNCSKKLEEIVLDGVYCSYKCIKLPAPARDVEKAPRSCRLERDGKWIWKQKYRYEGEVPQRLRNDPSTNVYRCEHCHFLHVGHDRALGTEQARLVRDSGTLGSTLLRARESRGETRKDVATKLKIRPIRIKEIEEADETVNTEVLFKLISYYRMKLNLLF